MVPAIRRLIWAFFVLCSLLGNKRIVRLSGTVSAAYDPLELPTESHCSFESSPNLRILDLSVNDLQYLGKPSFTRLKHLRRLSLESNPSLRLSELLKALSAVPSLAWLDCKACSISLPAGDAFQGVKDSQLQILTLSFIPQLVAGGVLNLTQFNVFRRLKSLDIGYDRILRLDYDGSIGLETLFLDSNLLSTFPVTCNGNASLYPHLKYLNLNFNPIEVLNISVCLPALETLSLSDTKFMETKTRMFDVDKFPALKDLTLGFHSAQDRYPYLNTLRDYSFQSSSLTSLSLVHAKLELETKNLIYDAAFANLPNLRVLNLTDNIFLDLGDARFHLLFGHLTLLRVLRLDQCAWNRISVDTFTPFRQLSTLSLQANRLVSIPEGAFYSLPYLTYLDVSSNRLAVITEDTFSPQLRGRLTGLALNNNPFQCTCDLAWFSGFMWARPALFNLQLTRYRCTNLKATEVMAYPPNPQVCLLSQQSSVLIIFTCTFFTVTLTLVALVFRFRWHIRLALYEAFRGKGADHRRMRLQADDFDYDVFVSYAAEDLPWVRERLMPELEGRLGLRLCVHERDFIPGKNIVDNIADCVQSSKKILMVFSRDFVKSQWCQFELALCLSHAMEHDDVLLIVCVDDVTSRRMTSAMMAVLRTTTYIQWEENADAIRSFWGRVGQALQEITNRRVAEVAV